MYNDIRSELRRVHAEEIIVQVDERFEPKAGALLEVELNDAYWHLLPEHFLELLVSLAHLLLGGRNLFLEGRKFGRQRRLVGRPAGSRQVVELPQQRLSLADGPTPRLLQVLQPRRELAHLLPVEPERLAGLAEDVTIEQLLDLRHRPSLGRGQLGATRTLHPAARLTTPASGLRSRRPLGIVLACGR